MQKIGRNDPCWCGSGHKYKNCHMDFDEMCIRDRYNTMLKDDKTYPYIKATIWEDFPRLLFSRRCV